ncbi:MAG: ATP-dependent DNA helicase RecG [Candidatus Lernaella stagnicola]|nr:ATP-dependent DNA helicase RecG [Candidatus Lernaella stagnicola]
MGETLTPYHSRYLRPITDLPGVGPKTAEHLLRKNVLTVADLLYCLPLRYDDRRRPTAIADLEADDCATVCGTLQHIHRFGGRGRQRRTVAELSDATGTVSVTWFGFAGHRFEDGDEVLLSGPVGEYSDTLQLQNPDGETVEKSRKSSQLVPIYSETEGVRQRTWRKLIAAALEEGAADWIGAVPADLRGEYDLLTLGEALRLIHAPPNDTAEIPIDAGARALRSLVFEDVFAFQLALALRRRERGGTAGIAFQATVETVTELLVGLPFSLTKGQEHVWQNVLDDLRAAHPMHRLVHGDVASGKTALAMLAAGVAARNGYQTAVLVPTEILAEQHAARFAGLLEPLGVRTALATGSVTGAGRRRLADRIALGVEDVVVGTHALLSGDLQFNQLGLVVIDEQHKFGVNQRASLISKGSNPDVLVLTATPIPRSLALTLYGDLDVSLLRDKPGGEGRVETRLTHRRERQKVYERVAAWLREGRQAYIICPRLDANETGRADVASLYDELAGGALAGFRLAVLHGRMQTDARKQVVEAFAAGRLDAVVATSVIEVGIDVPNAAVLVIEDAELFGLSQLHQMRGRIGRDGRPGWCFLIHADGLSEAAQERLAYLERCRDGFSIAETDMRLRGPGELLGDRQSGLPPLRFAKEALTNVDLLVSTRDAAESTLTQDAHLATPRNRWTKMVVMERWGALLGEGRYG